MIPYLLKSAACLLLMLAVYRLLLEKEKMFRFNRFFLLFSIVFSFIAPCIIMPGGWQTHNLPKSIPVISQIDTWTAPQILTAGPATPQTNPISISHILLTIYCIVAAGFLARFTRNLIRILRRIAKNEKIRISTGCLVLIPEQIISHSFCQYIFVNKTEYQEHQLENEVLIHEQAHVRQKHSLDIIFIELLQTLCWFNPILIGYKRAIQLNHEFLADDEAAQTAPTLRAYQYLLLNKVSHTTYQAMTSSLNYTITKKRLIMITKTSNKKSALFRQTAACTLLAGALFLFSNAGQAQTATSDTQNYPNRTIEGSETLGAKPYVLIDGKEYAADILEKISPTSIQSTSLSRPPQSKEKYGDKAADGWIELKTFHKKIAYITQNQRENIEKEKAAKTDFFYHLTLKKDDGSRFDKYIVNFSFTSGKGSISTWSDTNMKIAFVAENRLFTENQAAEAEAFIMAQHYNQNCSVYTQKKPEVPGLDLSSYDAVFYFAHDPAMNKPDAK